MNLYELLGVKSDVTGTGIKKAYYSKSKTHHPDVGGDAEVFKQMVLAYSILSDPEKRAKYDGGEAAESIAQSSQSLDFQIVNTLVQLFCNIVMNANVDQQDIVDLMKQNMRNSLGQIRAAQIAERAKIKRFESAIRRMKSSGEDNVFVSSGNAQINSINIMLGKLDEQVQIAEGGAKFLEAYSYEFDQQVVTIMLGGYAGAFATSTSTA